MPQQTPFQLSCSAVPKSARVVAFQGHEAISQLYRFTLGVVVPDGDHIAIDAAITARATLTIASEQGPQHYHGVLGAIEMVHAWQDHSLYRLTLQPELADLALTRHSVVYVDADAPKMWRTLTHAQGALPDGYARQALSASYAPRLHVCQYKESNLQFLQRQLEREGAYYFFAHDGDPLEPEQLIITDHKESHQSSRQAPVRYVPLTKGAAMGGDAMDGWAMRATPQPRDVTTNDFDYLHPALEVSGGPVTVSSDGGGGHVYHGDDVRTPEEAGRQSTVRAEVMRCARVRFVGNGRVHHLRAGHTFELSEHPHDAMNRGYLAIEVHHYGLDGADAETLARLRLSTPPGGEVAYHATVTAIASDVQYRHPRITPVPRIDSIERGFVDGPDDSEYGQLDEHGRYKVAIHFDERWRSAPDGEGKCSTWVRMLQPHSGVTEGFHFPLRKGTEVMLAFIGGDPDRPIIMGAAPNALQPSPVTSNNSTQNVIRTGGDNSLIFDDEKDNQWIQLHTPAEDTFIYMGAPRHYRPGPEFGEGSAGAAGAADTTISSGEASLVMHTGQNWTADIHGKWLTYVHKDVEQHYLGNHELTVAKKQEITVAETQKLRVIGNAVEDYQAGQYTYVKALRSLSVTDGNYIVEVTGDEKHEATGSMLHKAGADLSMSAPVISAQASASATLDFGNTTLKFGPTSVDWGPTSGSILSLGLDIPGGVKIDTPLYKVSTGSFMESIGSKFDKCVAKIGVFAIKAEYSTLSASTSGLKIETKGLHKAQVGLELESKGPSIGTAAVRFLSAGLISFS